MCITRGGSPCSQSAQAATNALAAVTAQLDGIERIRYMTSHPRDMEDDLIAAHAEVPQLIRRLNPRLKAIA